MGIIQGSINNLLALAGVATRLAPGLQDKIKVSELKRSIENLENKQGEPEAEDFKVIEEKTKELAKLEPTKENQEKAKQASEKVKKEEEAKQKAEEELKLQQERLKKSQEFRTLFTEGGKWK